MEFKHGDEVLCKAEGNKRVKWMRATVVKKESERTYKIKLEGGRIRLCHGDQLRKFYKKDLPIVIPPSRKTIDITSSTPSHQTPINSPGTSSTPNSSPHTPQNTTNIDDDLLRHHNRYAN